MTLHCTGCGGGGFPSALPVSGEEESVGGDGDGFPCRLQC